LNLKDMGGDGFRLAEFSNLVLYRLDWELLR